MKQVKKFTTSLDKITLAKSRTQTFTGKSKETLSSWVARLANANFNNNNNNNKTKNNNNNNNNNNNMMVV